jgi:hypothetical protein
MNLHLLIDYYKFTGPNPNRQVELDTCFIDNINNKNFYKVHVFSDDILPSITKRVIHNKPNKRLTYRDYFDYAADNIPEGDIVVLANSDIYFDDTISKAKLICSKFNNIVLALTRWCPYKGHKVENDEIIPYSGARCCQDTWVWKNKLQNYQDKDTNFLLGTYGCDNSIAHAFLNMGYFVSNPSLEIVTYHLHKEDSDRQYVTTHLPYSHVYVKLETQSLLNLIKDLDNEFGFTNS